MEFLDIAGTNRQLGEAFGEQAREIIRRDFEIRFERNPSLLLTPKAVEEARQVIATRHPEVLEELKGIARGAGVDVRQVLSINQVDVFDEEGCTPLAVRTTPEGPIVAKNTDLSPKEATWMQYLIRRCRPSEGMAFVQVAQPGWLTGYNMINEAGLAVTSGSVGSVFPPPEGCLDFRLRLYGLMRTCRSVRELIAGLRDGTWAGKGISFAAGDAEGNVAIIEAALPHIAVRDENKPFIYSTNLFKAKGFESADLRHPVKKPICEYRWGYLRWVEENHPPKDVEDVKQLLAGHEPWAPCRHGGSHGSVTVYSMISLCWQRKALIAHGPPCENEYQEYSL
ncbi:MAG: hypothetical protein JXA11_12770 [Phycisphaerae bacterium]|nr:hypothetical protein [Phycisphaerae bacterium]